MRVRRALATAGKVALGCLVLLVLSVLAMVGTNVGLRMNAGSLRSAVMLPPADEDLPSTPEATPAEIIAARFPTQDAVSQPTTFSPASVLPAERREALDVAATARTATVETAWPAADGVAPAAPALTEAPVAPEASDAVRPSDMAKPDMTKPDAAKPDATKPRRLPARSPNVLNDAMIANIRRQLKLTPDQAQLWPPVEAALRKIVYTRTAMNGKGGAANIDTNSPEVEELKTAALPLLMRLTSEQKREVRQIAFLMGLESLASQF
jgi:hypothetical protein